MALEIIDLHTHTTHSDGTLTPSELLVRASQNGVSVLAITDHDSVACYEDPAIFAQATDAGIELIPGIEISASEGEYGLHVLGLFIDPSAVAIRGLVRDQQQTRRVYAHEAVEELSDYGWKLDMATDFESGTSVTKAHIADAVLRDKANESLLLKIFGELPTRGNFIEAMMNHGCPCYVKRQTISTEKAITAIHDAGGVSVLSHPVAYHYEGIPDDAVFKAIVKNDFDAVEAIYYYFNKSRSDEHVDRVAEYTLLSKNLRKLVTGGSDYHGPSASVGNMIEVGMPDQKVRMTTAQLDALRGRANEWKQRIAEG